MKFSFKPIQRFEWFSCQVDAKTLCAIIDIIVSTCLGDLLEEISPSKIALLPENLS